MWPITRKVYQSLTISKINFFQSPPKGVTVPYTPLKAVTVSGINGVGNLNNLPLPTIFPSSQAILPTQTISQAQVNTATATKQPLEKSFSIHYDELERTKSYFWVKLSISHLWGKTKFESDEFYVIYWYS